MQSSTSKAEGCPLPRNSAGEAPHWCPRRSLLPRVMLGLRLQHDLGEMPSWQRVMEQEEPGRTPGSQLHPDRWGPAGGTTGRSETGQDPSVGPTWPGPALTLVGSGDPSQGCISTQRLHGNKKYVERGQRGRQPGQETLGRRGWGCEPCFAGGPACVRSSPHTLGRGEPCTWIQGEVV